MSYARTGSVGLLPLYPRAGAYILVGKPRQPLRCHVLQRPHLSSGGTPYTLYDLGWLFVFNFRRLPALWRCRDDIACC